MPRFQNGTRTGWGCVVRVETLGPNPTLEQAVEQVQHPLDGLTRPALVETIAALAARVVALETGIDRRAVLALSQVEAILRDYRSTTEQGAPPHEQPEPH